MLYTPASRTLADISDHTAYFLPRVPPAVRDKWKRLGGRITFSFPVHLSIDLSQPDVRAQRALDALGDGHILVFASDEDVVGPVRDLIRVYDAAWIATLVERQEEGARRQSDGEGRADDLDSDTEVETMMEIALAPTPPSGHPCGHASETRVTPVSPPDQSINAGPVSAIVTGRARSGSIVPPEQGEDTKRHVDVVPRLHLDHSDLRDGPGINLFPAAIPTARLGSTPASIDMDEPHSPLNKYKGFVGKAKRSKGRKILGHIDTNLAGPSSLVRIHSPTPLLHPDNLQRAIATLERGVLHRRKFDLCIDLPDELAKDAKEREAHVRRCLDEINSTLERDTLAVALADLDGGPREDRVRRELSMRARETSMAVCSAESLGLDGDQFEVDEASAADAGAILDTTTTSSIRSGVQSASTRSGELGHSQSFDQADIHRRVKTEEAADPFPLDDKHQRGEADLPGASHDRKYLFYPPSHASSSTATLPSTPGSAPDRTQMQVQKKRRPNSFERLSVHGESLPSTSNSVPGSARSSGQSAQIRAIGRAESESDGGATLLFTPQSVNKELEAEESVKQEERAVGLGIGRAGKRRAAEPSEMGEGRAVGVVRRRSKRVKGNARE